MPTGLVDNHGHVLVGCNRFGELVEINLHRRRLDLRHHQSKCVVSAGLGDSEEVGEGKTLVSETRWALAPAMAESQSLLCRENRHQQAARIVDRSKETRVCFLLSRTLAQRTTRRRFIFFQLATGWAE
jgi:hypothetical protein